MIDSWPSSSVGMARFFSKYRPSCSSLANFLVLQLRELDKNLAGGMFNFELLQNRRTAVGDDDICRR
ncbi:hypothetical protein QR680_000418 [Steinernema hermaphroditum]|uniref:Uncharacterized protein n=1 Tax=Steinernema hermaphroditum TaxID=289476 RepID=A0AA39GUI8_9BILA|nr:hypothetical protein QR680_000418 [Steinernema hermaphroditum]